MLLPDLAKEIESKLENNLSSTRTQIDPKPKSTRIGTRIVQPIFRLHNSSSVYKQMIRSSYENSLDRLLHVENQSATACREATIFDVFPDPVESPLDSLDFITNALARCNSNIAKVIPSHNYSTTCEKSPALMISRFNMALPSKPRGKLALVELS